MSATPETAFPEPGAARARPLLAQGVELLGPLEGSGFKEAPFMVRRQDGQMIQLPPLLYRVAERADGRHEVGAVAEELSNHIGRRVRAADVDYLVEEKLRPLGIVAAPDGSSPPVQKKRSLLGLTWQRALVPDRGVRRLTGLFLWLFHPASVMLAVAGFLALDGWLLFSHGLAQPVRAAVYQPVILLALFGGVVLATAFHEVGHATACRYGGARPGVIGVGIYVIWPVFYTDVTDAYRLPRSGRLRTDLGGVYFNAIFGVAAGAAYFATGSEPLLLLVLLQNAAMLQQLIPLGRLDGYLIVSDLTGVPDILTRLRPILSSLVPWRPADKRVGELKPWARVAVSSYVLVLVPVMLVMVVLVVMHAPRAFATAYDSLTVQWDALRTAFGEADVVSGLLGGLQVAALVIPCLGIVATTARLGSRAGIAAVAWAGGEPLRRAVVVAGATSIFTLAALTWWPNGDYRPIQPGERGTVQAGLENLAAVPSGRPALSTEREWELGGAPGLRDRPGDHRARHSERSAPAAPRPEPLQDGVLRDEDGFTLEDEPAPYREQIPYDSEDPPLPSAPEQAPPPAGGTAPAQETAPAEEPPPPEESPPAEEEPPAEEPAPSDDPTTTTPEPAPDEGTSTTETPPSTSEGTTQDGM